jgi:two-component system chemotaxis response regulator CheB
MVNVLIADDSMLTRTVIRDLLSRDQNITVVGEVSDGQEAVRSTCRLRPDLVIMDVMMPVMDGLAATVEIMACCPTPILILSANVDPKDSRSAFNAIKHGALDVMEKPQGVVTEAFEEIAAQLIQRVKFLSKVRVIHHFRRPRQRVPAAQPADHRRSVLAIGASTGGPKAVMRLMKELPRETGAQVLIVQHIARGFAAGFAEWLDRESPLTVRLAREGDPLEEGVALVAPNGVHMEVQDGRIVLSDAAPVNSCRPSVDVLFHSLARSDLAARAVGVLFTGMGRDGAEGMAALRRSGGYNIAQDEASSAVFGMPRAAIDLGGVHQTLALADIPAAVVRLMQKDAEEPDDRH